MPAASPLDCCPMPVWQVQQPPCNSSRFLAAMVYMLTGSTPASRGRVASTDERCLNATPVLQLDDLIKHQAQKKKTGQKKTEQKAGVRMWH